MLEKITSQEEAKSSSDLPTFPSDFSPFIENCSLDNDSLVIPESYQEIILNLANLGQDSREELYHLILKNIDSKQRYISNLRTGKETGFEPSFYISEDNDNSDLIRTSEVIHTHTVGKEFNKDVYAFISDTDLWEMRNRQMDKVWVLAPFHTTSVLVVEAIEPKPNAYIWIEAYLKFKELLIKDVTYQDLLNSLIALSDDLGINIFSGETGDTMLKKLN